MFCSCITFGGERGDFLEKTAARSLWRYKQQQSCVYLHVGPLNVRGAAPCNAQRWQMLWSISRQHGHSWTKTAVVTPTSKMRCTRTATEALTRLGSQTWARCEDTKWAWASPTEPSTCGHQVLIKELPALDNIGVAVKLHHWHLNVLSMLLQPWQ